MMSSLSAICCFLLLLKPVLLQRSDDFLDLTKPRSPQKQRAGGKGTGGGGVIGDGITLPKRVIPVKVTLLSLDKSSYQLGDQVIYEVALENITDDTLVIPWSVDYDRVKPDEEKEPPGYIDAYLSLVIKDEMASNQSVAGQGLYGSQLLQGSLKSLSPGQRARIRAPGNWRFSHADVAKRMLEKVPQTFEVRADYTLYDRPINPRFGPAISSNSLTVELKRRQQ